MAGSGEERRPLASEEEERLVQDLFPIQQSPGEYAARYGAPGCLHHYGRLRYRDARTERWVRAVVKIVSSPALLARVRAHAKASQG